MEFRRGNEHEEQAINHTSKIKRKAVGKMYLKLDNGKLSFIQAVYPEGTKLCFVIHDGTVIHKDYYTEEIVRLKTSNLESHISNRIQIVDLQYL